MSTESFEQFRQIVLRDAGLQDLLRAITDHKSFIDLIVRIGDERNCQFTPADVKAAMRLNRMAWLQHRLVP